MDRDSRYRYCPACTGTGRLEPLAPCPACHGRGVELVAEEDQAPGWLEALAVPVLLAAILLAVGAILWADGLL